MANDSRRKRHLILALVAAGAVCALVVVVLIFAVNYLRPPGKPQTAAPGSTAPPNAQPPTVPSRPKKPRPEFQDASCPDVQVVSVPGTWESAPDDDPLNPTRFPNALMLNVSRPLAQQFDSARAQIYTVP
jgi:hypothetical protein